MSALSLSRRQVLAGAATIAFSANAGAIEMDGSYWATATNGSGPGAVTGSGVGDFDFLAGEWRIAHRRLVDGSDGEWQEFTSGATVHRVLDGMASIEELRQPNGNAMGMGVRVWLPQEEMWADHWTSAANGVVNAPQKGRFIDHAGIFVSEEQVDGTNWLYRGVWDLITPASCRWHQSSSKDGGSTWQWNWWMDWTRVTEFNHG